jgi:hypothetical protein
MPFNISFEYKGKKHLVVSEKPDQILNNLDKYCKTSKIELSRAIAWKLKIVKDTSLISQRIAKTIFQTIVFWHKNRQGQGRRSYR